MFSWIYLYIYVRGEIFAVWVRSGMRYILSVHTTHVLYTPPVEEYGRGTIEKYVLCVLDVINFEAGYCINFFIIVGHQPNADTSIVNNTVAVLSGCWWVGG